MLDKRLSVLDLSTGQTRLIRNERPLVTSGQAGWQGFVLEEVRNAEVHLENVSGLYHVVWLNVDAPLSFEWHGEGRSVSKTIAPGQAGIGPAKLPFSARHRTKGSVIRVGLEQNFVLCATAELGFQEPITPCCLHGIDDPLLREILLGLRSEAQNTGREGALYAESLATMLAILLVQKYSGQKRTIGEHRKGCLPRFALSRVVDYIHDNLSEKISLGALAGLAGLSPFHFGRMFKQSTGMAPHKYVIHCRVMRARELLLVDDVDIADVAARVGFCDQSHLAAHFKSTCGLTPTEFVQRMSVRKKLL
jgi:AraC family transcriptional regulator